MRASASEPEGGDRSVTEERLEACCRRLDHVAEQGLQEQADALEFVHRSLVAELDDLLDEDRPGPRRD